MQAPLYHAGIRGFALPSMKALFVCYRADHSCTVRQSILGEDDLMPLFESVRTVFTTMLALLPHPVTLLLPKVCLRDCQIVCSLP
jgi:hypothetical protein